MAYRRVKTAPKFFQSNPAKLKAKVLTTMGKVANIVGSSLGPGGRVTLIESDLPGIAHRITKDGVSIFKSLGSEDAFEHLIIETARDAATRTVAEAGDGTTTATVLSEAIIKNLFDFCEKNPKYSPQRAVRKISKYTNNVLLPYIRSRSIKVDEENKHLLKMVAKISANGDEELAQAVIDAFEAVGFGDASHVTIRENPGPKGYSVARIDGFPWPIGAEDSIGRLQAAFINDQGNQRIYLEKPLFILFDGNVSDLIPFTGILNELGKRYTEIGDSDYRNIVIVAHGFADNVITSLAFNWADPSTMNVMPLVTPMAQFNNGQQHALYDLAAFTGAKVFGMKDQLNQATLEDLGGNMESIECYRFRSTIVGDPDPVSVEVRAEDLRKMKIAAESIAEKIWIEERLGKITNGIAKITVSAGSNGEIKEISDRVEDAVCAVRASITHGVLPGGCRIAIDMALLMAQELPEGDPAREVLMAALMSLPQRLLDNAGYQSEEIGEVLSKLIDDPSLSYDIENELFGKAEELGLFDATKAVEQSLNNAVSIAGVLGTLGGIVAHPRDNQLEREEAKKDNEYLDAVNNPESFKNEANDRP